MDDDGRSKKEVYNGMERGKHLWTRHTSSEVDFILNQCNIKSGKILDLGCGNGRHSLELASRSFDVTGIDFSETCIGTAIDEARNRGLSNVEFILDDCRNHKFSSQYNLVLALYDIVGTFISEAENLKIIKRAYESLIPDGYFVLSVMNMDYTHSIALPENVGSFSLHPEILENLKSSDTMQTSGNVFKPEYYAINTDNDLVYRKEVFENSGIKKQHIVIDKRYTRKEIIRLLKLARFEILDFRYIRLGHWDTPLGSTDKGAKEMLLIAKRV